MMRMTWNQICSQSEFRGRCVALDGCRYDETTAQPTEGVVVDVDDDLVELCHRVREAALRSCSIVFCDEKAPPAGPN